ncbi:hypothetical protein Tco_0505975 [Tanacetum coccineum]
MNRETLQKVKHLENKLKSTTTRRKARLVISDEEVDLVLEDPSKLGRMEDEEFEDVEEKYLEVKYHFDLDQTLLQQVTPTKGPHVEVQSQDSFEAELSVLSTAKILAEASSKRVKTYDRRRRSTDSSNVSTAEGLFSTAGEIQGTDKELARKVQEEEQAKALEQQEQ